MKISNVPSNGKPETEMSKLKRAWLKLTEDEQAGWQEALASHTNAQMRQLFAQELNIHLKHDPQCSRFREWELDQRARADEAERVQEDYHRLVEEFGKNWTLEQVREEVIKRCYARALSRGDFKLALATVREDVRLQRVALEERRVVVVEKKSRRWRASGKPSGPGGRRKKKTRGSGKFYSDFNHGWKGINTDGHRQK
jgi:hypothetical protein